MGVSERGPQTRVCVSLAQLSHAQCLAVLERHRLAELRLDQLQLTHEQLGSLCATGATIIATCRPPALSDQERMRALCAALDAGAAYVDVELDADGAFRDELIAYAKQKSARVIVSFHDMQGTGSPDELGALVDSCFGLGADVAKIACVVSTSAEAARLLGLLDDPRPVVVAGMGQAGRIVRLAAPLLGSPFTYASLQQGLETAPGQLAVEVLERVYDMLAAELGIELA